ncbi:MAG TPA: iron-containing alcohol dehydrogenase [Opitutaceae bacterium]|nr:iron-containing alcohol dehydrogenase [Opitutaceae bacterium]
MSVATANFKIPDTIICGGGALSSLSAQLERLRTKRVLLVTDAFMVQSGLVARVEADLRKAGCDVGVFSGVQPDPTEDNVLAGLAQFRELRAEAVIALGGGSPIDCAKAITILTANPPPLRQYMGRHKIPHAGAPLIAVPTTAGTGSEVTKVAVITDTANDVKMMMLDAHLVPTVALVDYELTLTMPAALTAAVGVDTLTHGIEAYVSRLASPVTDPIALSCIGHVARHLETAWRDPGNAAAREGMMLAAMEGGMAFANSSVCLVHGMSRPLGALFHVPHGISNAMLLPAVTRFSLPGAIARYATVARTMGWSAHDASDEAAAQALLEGLEELNRRLQIPRLRAHPRMQEQKFFSLLEKMAADALASGSPQNNPVVPTAPQIVELYRAAW